MKSRACWLCHRNSIAQPISLSQFTMVAHRWLQQAVAVANENWRLQQQPKPPQNADNQEEHTVAEERDSFSEHSDNCSQSNMSVSDTEEPAIHGPVNLADCGPSVEQHIAHVADGLDHLGALSTRKQCERKWEECKEFAKVVLKLRQSLWTAAPNFCNSRHTARCGSQRIKRPWRRQKQKC